MKPTLKNLDFVIKRVRRDGLASVARTVMARAANTMVDAWHLSEPSLPLREPDICDPGLVYREAPARRTAAPLSVGWVCTPPAPGSGGHTTFFRMVKGLEDRGHQCTLFLYDRNDDDVDRHTETIRRYWPELRAVVRSATDGMEGVDAIVASSWPTAHVVAARAPRGVHLFYFIQDYEPYFYPRGAHYALAEDSYRLGLTNVALGAMIGEAMKAELGFAPGAVVPFGCDTGVYRLLHTAGQAPRTGVVYYAKKSVDRRGYLLAKLALEQFHALHPEQEIHIYGDVITGWSVPVTNHGNLAPRELNKLYNRTIAGLAISFTNISLVPGELLAAGNVPVLNKAAFASGLLTEAGPIWASATPAGLAAALAEVVSAPDIAARAISIAGRDRPNWAATQSTFADLVEAACTSAPSTLADHRLAPADGVQP
ncbi:glycosyltransferase family 1 protein [Paenarthrobacter sp. NPDC056912]|uniref:glycosyltransferase family 1 protein n=1 Tax=Paenarthrobacter sp. NPDC056912 TaxID=3345965 RepID=UPI00366E74B0